MGHNYPKNRKRPDDVSSLVGKKFGAVEIIGTTYKTVKRTTRKNPCQMTLVIGRCQCGNEKSYMPGNLELLRSCGCLKKELNAPYFFPKTHGLSKNRHYDRWISMLDRCYNKRHKQYHDYGGRGIRVCDRWKEAFANFLEDMEASFSEGLTLDRINNDGDYSHDNCKWSTWHEQNTNKREQA